MSTCKTGEAMQVPMNMPLEPEGNAHRIQMPHHVQKHIKVPVTLIEYRETKPYMTIAIAATSATTKLTVALPCSLPPALPSLNLPSVCLSKVTFC
jgi:hypothetical protein